MAGITKLLEPRYKKVFTKRMSKTGMSERLRTIDTVLLKDYVTQGGGDKFVAKVTGADSAKSDDARMLKGFKDNWTKIDKIITGHKNDWKKPEKKFFTDIKAEFDAEIKYWTAEPCQAYVKKLKEAEENVAAVENAKKADAARKWIEEIRETVQLANRELESAGNALDGAVESLKNDIPKDAPDGKERVKGILNGHKVTQVMETAATFLKRLKESRRKYEKLSLDDIRNAPKKHKVHGSFDGLEVEMSWSQKMTNDYQRSKRTCEAQAKKSLSAYS